MKKIKKILGKLAIVGIIAYITRVIVIFNKEMDELGDRIAR